jgi:hypothetical protein
MKSSRTTLVVVALLALLCAAEPSAAVDAQLARVNPRGAMRGTEVELTLTGNLLADAQEVLFYQPGITVKELKAENAQTLKVKVAIAPDARPGEYALRVRTATGISHLRTFYVGLLPPLAEAEPNNEFSQPQKVELNHTITGVVENEDVDYYFVDAKQGQRITAEVEALRLATTFFDPFVAILDAERFELSASDDTALLLQDSVASVIAPKDGRYIIQIRESSYGGNGDCHYRLHVGTFPRPTMVFPAGGQAGQDVNVQFIGDVAGPFSQSVKLPAGPADDKFGLLAEQNGQLAPSANLFRVSPFPNVLEAEPNDALAQATLATGELPLSFNGIIEKSQDMDFFKFTAKAGQQFHVQAYARRLRSPLDLVIVLCNAKGETIVASDDTGGPDAYARFGVPADGEYALYVFDFLRQGGPDYVYRVEITPVQPALTLSIPALDQNNNSQERQTIVVPKGNRFATLVRATRADFGGEVTLSADGLPAGITMNAENVAENLDVVPVVFEATPDAPVAGKLLDLTGACAKPEVAVKGVFRQTVNLVPNNQCGNAQPFYVGEVGKLAVAVADEAPFKINIVQPKVPLVQGGSMQLKVVAEKKPDFKAPIYLQMVFYPPGIGAGTAQINPDQNEAVIPLNAEDGAQARKWKIAVMGAADLPNGRVWVSTQLAELEVAPPFMTMKMEMATVEQGKPGQVLVNIEHKTPFEGKAKVQLVGFPPNVTGAPDVMEVAAGDKAVTFNINTTDKAPVGQHPSLLCIVTVTKDGEPIVHNLARGGVIRVDAPPPPAAPAAAAAPMSEQPAPPPAAPEAKPLSRLEKLRQEAAAKK